MLQKWSSPSSYYSVRRQEDLYFSNYFVRCRGEKGQGSDSQSAIRLLTVLCQLSCPSSCSTFTFWCFSRLDRSSLDWKVGEAASLKSENLRSSAMSFHQIQSKLASSLQKGTSLLLIMIAYNILFSSYEALLLFLW